MKRIAFLIVLGMAVACGGVDPGGDPSENSTQLRTHTIQPDVVRAAGFCQIGAGGALTGTCLVNSDWGCIRTRQASCLQSPSGFTATMPSCGSVVVDPQRRCASIVPF